MEQSSKLDYYRMTGNEYRAGLKSIAMIVGAHQIRYMMLWRKASKRMTLFRKWKLYRYSRKYGLEISPGARIGKGLYLGHPYNITVGNGVVIGDNCNLHKGCTIGQENRGKRKGVPTLGNRVFVGINSTITGKIQIGDDVMISPNTFVNFDVPAHSVVIGNPATVHPKEEATKGYIGYCV